MFNFLHCSSLMSFPPFQCTCILYGILLSNYNIEKYWWNIFAGNKSQSLSHLITTWKCIKNKKDHDMHKEKTTKQTNWHLTNLSKKTNQLNPVVLFTKILKIDFDLRENALYCSFSQKFLWEYLRVKSVVTLRQF